MVEGEGEHAVEFVERLLAPGNERVEQDFRVAGTPQSDSERLELRPQPAEVVDLAVEDQAVACFRMEHRLMAGGREVEDREPAKPKPDGACRRPGRMQPGSDRKLLVARVIGSAVDHRAHHRTHRWLHQPRIGSDGPGDSAHLRAPDAPLWESNELDIQSVPSRRADS